MIKKGISGLRGTVAPGEESLTAESVARWSQAYVAEVQARQDVARPRIALGHDARRSSPAIASLVRGALLLAGVDVFDLGLALTPTVQLYIRHARLDGGIMVTASHNPIIYNGLKFLNKEGFFLPLDWWGDMAARLADSTLPAVGLDRAGSVAERGEAAWKVHLAAAVKAVDLDEIRALRLRVALDACNGGAVRWAEFLELCGCETVLLHSEHHGFFSREAEPLPEHLTTLGYLVRQARCDLGFAADPDGDRLVVVDADGSPVSEEHTVVLAALSLAGRSPHGTVVVNVVTTHAIEDMVRASVVRTAVGEMNVVDGVIQHDALLGGEGSGGIIVPHINMARDGLAAMAMILRLLARQKGTLRDLLSRIPRWQSVKAKVTTSATSDVLRHLFVLWVEEPPIVSVSDELLDLTSSAGFLRLARAPESVHLRAETRGGGHFNAEGGAAGLDAIFTALAGARPTLDLTDGVKVSTDNAWISLRPSNTEPIVRIMGEVRA